MLSPIPLLKHHVSAAARCYTGPGVQLGVVLVAFEDHVKYVSETNCLAPWRTVKFPADVTLEALWRDDKRKPAKALAFYEGLKAKRILVHRASGFAQC